VLDEPVAGLDPLARREFLSLLMTNVAEHDLTVVLSSHLISDIERVCDYLIVLASSRVQLAGDVHSPSRAAHTRSSSDIGATPKISRRVSTSIDASHTDRQTTLVVRASDASLDPAWDGRGAWARGPRPRIPRSGRARPTRPAHEAARYSRRIRRPPSATEADAMTWVTWRQSRVQALTVLAAFVALGAVARARAFLAALENWWLAERSTPQPKAQPHTATGLAFEGGWALFLGYELAQEIEPHLAFAALTAPLGCLRAAHARCPGATTLRAAAYSQSPKRTPRMHWRALPARRARRPAQPMCSTRCTSSRCTRRTRGPI